MSQITWKKRLVLFILFIGSFLVFNNLTGKVSGYNYSLISVQINGENALGNSSFLIQARLHSNLVLNASWRMYYNPALEHCSVKFLLFNNKSSIFNSTEYSDIGSSINHLLTIPLLPQNWSLAGGKEYGAVSILFYLFDGASAKTNTYTFPILVLPEELNCSISSIILENDTSGRMKQFNLVYSIKSIQDPSYIHSGLGFTCNILDINNNSIGIHDFFVNNSGFLNITIWSQYLIDLENNSFLVKSSPSNYIMPVTITGKLSNFIHRIDFILYFLNISETNQDGNSSISLFFTANSTRNDPGNPNQSLYLTWCLLNENLSQIDSGCMYINLCSVFSIEIQPAFIANLENLSLRIWFEGNFRFKGKEIEWNLDKCCCRENVDISLINLQELQQWGYGDLCFRLNRAQTSNFLANYQAEIDLLNIVNNSIGLELIKVTDSSGCFNISLSQQIMRDLESYEIKIISVASLDFKENITNFVLDKLFSRAQPEISMKNDSILSLDSTIHNTLEFKLDSIDYTSYPLDGSLMAITLIDATDRVLDRQYMHIDSTGLIEYIIPVDLITSGKDIFINLFMNATFLIKQLSFTGTFHIQAINKESGQNSNQPYVYSLSIILPSICVLGMLLIFKRYKKHFLSKKSFKISVK